MVFEIMLICALWIFGGLIGSWCVEDEFYDFNPLWILVLISAGPISIAIWMGIRMVKGIKSYIKRVKNYYIRKRERQEFLEKRELRKRRSVWGDYHENR